MDSADDLLDAPIQASADQFLDQGGTATAAPEHTADTLLDSPHSAMDTIKSGAKTIAHAVMTPLRGYEAMGVGAAKMIGGASGQEALSRAAEATKPGFEPKGVAENVGSFVGGTVPLLAMPVSEAAVGASRAAKLIHAAKIGGLFGVGFSTLESLEKHGAVTMDDAEHIATSGVMNAVIGASAEAILGPIFSRIFKNKTAEVPGAEVPVPKTEAPPIKAGTPEVPLDDLSKIKMDNQSDLTKLVDVKNKIEQHGEALTSEAQQMLGEINKEVTRLQKLDKTYTTKQTVKELGINLEDQTPAKAEEILTRASKPDFVVAFRDGKKIVAGEPGDLHGTMEGRPTGPKSEAGYVDRNDGKFYTREEAAQAINPDFKKGDALHSQQLKDVQELAKSTPEEIRNAIHETTQAKNEFFKNYDKKGKSAAQVSKELDQIPEYAALNKRDKDLHDLLYNPEANKEQLAKLKDLTPAVQTDKGVIEGKPGQEHDDIIAQNNLDVVANNVKEGYVRKDDGQFVTKEDILGQSSVDKPKVAIEKGAVEQESALIKEAVKESNRLQNARTDFEEDAKASGKTLFDYQNDKKYHDLWEAELAAREKVEKLKSEARVRRGSTEEPQEEFYPEMDAENKKKKGTFITDRQRLINRWADETASAAKDLGYKNSKEALAWAEKSHHYLKDDYKLAFQNKFQSLMKVEPKIVKPIPPSKAKVSATPIEHGEPAGKTLKASEMPVGTIGQMRSDLYKLKDEERAAYSKYYDENVKLNTEGKPIPLKPGEGEKFSSGYEKKYGHLRKGIKDLEFKIANAEVASGDIPVERYSGKDTKLQGTSVFFSPEGKGTEDYGDVLTQTHLDTRNAKIYVDDSVIDFFKKRGLLDKPIPPKYRSLYENEHKTLYDLIDNSDEDNIWYRVYQAYAADVLKKEGYSGAHWLHEEDVLSPDQYQVWDPKIVKHEGLSQHLATLDALSKQLPPTAGANPEVADIINAAREATVGKKAQVKLKDDQTGNWKVEHNETHDIVTRELKTENKLAVEKDTKASGTVAEIKVPANILQSSSKLPGTEMAPAFIPEYVAGTSNFKLGWYSRVAKQTRTVLEGMGSAGKEMAAKIAMVDDASLIRSNNFLYNFDRYITQVPKRMREKAGIALMDALEGRKTDFKFPTGFVEHVQKMFGDFADDAKKLDFQILRADGSKVDWAERSNFAPRMVKQEFVDGILRGDGVTLNRIKQFLIESKQTPTEAQASQRVQALRRRYMERRYGHLERAREYDLPPEFYDRQGFSVIPEYVRAASHRMEEVRQFGQHDAKISELIDSIAGSGHDSVLARQIFDRYAGLEVSDEVYTRATQGVKNLVTGLSLQLPSTITQIGQILTPIHRATSPELGLGLAKSYGRAALALVKSFTSLGKEEAARAGQGFESMATDYLLDTYGGSKDKPFAKFAETALKASGFTSEDSFLRRFSATLGRDYIKNELIPRIIKNPNNKFAITEMRRLGLNPSIVRVQGGLSDFELNLATKRFADQTQGAPSVLNLPLWWSSPTGRFMTQFHTFSLVVGKENYLLAKDMISTGNINRLVSMGLGTPLVGAGISYIKEDIMGLKPTDFTGDKQTDQILRWYMNGTSFGVAADLMLSLTKGRDAFTGAFQAAPVGVLAGLTYDVKTALLQSDTKAGKSAAKRVAQKIPVVGRVLFQ